MNTLGELWNWLPWEALRGLPALLLFALGPGRFSLDRMLFGPRQRPACPKAAGDD